MGPTATGKERVTESFVARIWLERGSNGDPVWRGHIRHVQGKEEAYFQDLGKMNEFLETVSGVRGIHLNGRGARATEALKPTTDVNGKGD